MNSKELLAVIEYAIDQAATSNIAILDGYTDQDMENSKRCEQQIDELKNLKQYVVKTSVIEEANDEQMIKEAQAVIDKLWWCADNPGSKVTITVGDTAANLYDHAALVQTLADSLEYFISEM